MSRTKRSRTIAAEVRRYFGLSQAELGYFLGVTAGQVAHVEAGRRRFSPDTERWLLPLWILLPDKADDPDPLDAVPVPPSPVLPPDDEELRLLGARLDYCRHRAYQLRYELKQQDKQLAQLQHRRRGVQLLRALLLPAPDTEPLLNALKFFPRNRARDEQWLDWLDAAIDAAPQPSPMARRLQQLRLRLLEEEIAALEQLQYEQGLSADRA